MFTLYKFFYKKSLRWLMLAGGIIPLLTSTILAFSKDLFVEEDISTNFLEEYSSFLFILCMVFLIPFFETLIVQFLPLKLLNKYIKKHRYLYCIMAIWILALLFALLHPSELFYFFSAFFMGLVWGFLCFILIRKKQHPYIYTAFMHVIYNGVLVTGGNILKIILS